ncbi:MAG: hypothetical protein FJW14_04375 [Acidimicrobiia bacterium]|nr:hypothetical protein [Acidimicrobiia bacterium]
MEHRFDRIAKSVGAALTRREALWRLGKGVALAAAAAVGLRAAPPENCGHCCQAACRTLDIPPRGPEMAFCIQNCHETGVAIGPTGEISRTCESVCVPPPDLS